jgi:general secretion pathway protein F
MTLFSYKQINRSGRETSGAVDASSPEEARRKLRNQGIRVVHIEEANEGLSRGKAASKAVWGSRIKSKDVAEATRQLSILLLAGIPLVESLGVLVEQLGDSALSGILAGVRDRVNSGSALADAFSEYPKAFPKVFVSMVRAGESTGSLEQVLSRLADMSDKRARLTHQVRSALTYPAFMAVVGCSVVLFIMSYVLPSMTKLFTEMNMSLPLMTRLLISVSTFVDHWIKWILIGIVFLVAGFRMWLARPEARLIWDRMVLRLPGIGPVLIDVTVARFTRTLGVLLGSGVSIVESLELSEAVVSNTVMIRVIQQTREAVSRGQDVSWALAQDSIFPPVVIHMIAAGEKSGGMEEGLLRISDSLETQVDSKLAVLTSLLEPLMIIILGTIVGFIVLAVLLPVFDINKAVI